MAIQEITAVAVQKKEKNKSPNIRRNTRRMRSSNEIVIPDTIKEIGTNLLILESTRFLFPTVLRKLLLSVAIKISNPGEKLREFANRKKTSVIDGIQSMEAKYKLIGAFRFPLLGLAGAIITGGTKLNELSKTTIINPFDIKLATLDPRTVAKTVRLMRDEKKTGLGTVVSDGANFVKTYRDIIKEKYDQQKIVITGNRIKGALVSVLIYAGITFTGYLAMNKTGELGDFVGSVTGGNFQGISVAVPSVDMNWGNILAGKSPLIVDRKSVVLFGQQSTKDMPDVKSGNTPANQDDGTKDSLANVNKNEPLNKLIVKINSYLNTPGSTTQEFRKNIFSYLPDKAIMNTLLKNPDGTDKSLKTGKDLGDAFKAFISKTYEGAVGSFTQSTGQIYVDALKGFNAQEQSKFFEMYSIDFGNDLSSEYTRFESALGN